MSSSIDTTGFMLRRAGATFKGSDTAQGITAEGILDFVSPQRRAAVDRFASEYAAVRIAEQRKPLSAEAIEALPYRDLSGELDDMWQARAASFDRLMERVGQLTPGSMIDVGGGCGWMARRFAELGWAASVVDITVDGDGLGAAAQLDEQLLLARAEMDDLPFEDASVDLVVFNASLHYAPDVVTVLHEAARVVAPGGTMAVLDSPVFSASEAGDQMVAEFEHHAATQLATPAPTLFGPGYVTEADLRASLPSMTAWDRVDDRSGFVGAMRSRLGARRAGRETAKRPLLLSTRTLSTRPLTTRPLTTRPLTTQNEAASP